MADRPILFSAAEGMPDWLKKLDDDSLDAIMEVVGEGEAFRRYNEGKSAMRTWFLSRLANLAALEAAEGRAATLGIYVASKTKHADMWKRYRSEGVPIISTWIDEAGPGESGDLADLWRRCIAEASGAGALVLYREPDDVLKGGWIELGAALAAGVPVFAVGIGEFTVAHDTRITHCETIDEAMSLAQAAVGPDACPICAVPFAPDDMCLTDITEGTCHAECLAGSPMVDLETGEPLPEGAPAPVPYRYDSLFKDGQR